ncbi:MAG: lysophospholipid acyltransferase family protein [Kiritimatiellae bacterium]|nr:lysophospholipid acyltransferase family protein [Kiritimatiellia bacterium]
MKSRRAKKIKRLLRLPFEWAGIMLGIAVFSNLPRRWMLAVCDFVSAVMYRFDGRGRRCSLANLRVVRGGFRGCGIVPPAEVYNPTDAEEKIIRRSYRNMARTVGHAFWTCRNAIERVKQAGEMSAAGKKFLAENKPAVTVSGHIGCWEILSQLAFLEGHPMMSVAKDIGTGGMTKLLMKARTSIGQEIVHADGAFRPLMQGLKEGKSLGLLVDQVVKPKDGGIWVRFFGRPVPVSAAPAFFSAKGKAPIVVAWSRPLKDGRWRCEVDAVYSSDEARDIRGMTQKCIARLERIIRRHPSCWVLNYRYFRKYPTERELAHF